MPQDVLEAVVLGDRYRLGERIGRGGMADVHRAHDLRLGHEVAVKVFRPEVTGAIDPKRIARETRFLNGAQHPTLVSVLDASSPESPTAYLVMELVPGADLAHRLELGALAPEHVRRIGVDVADALTLLHAQQLVHRDVKPANILVLDADADTDADADADAGIGGAAKLADLGIAVGLDETRLTATNAILGTAAYLSPEQVQGRSVGPASDVYALGLVLIESLTGQRTFAGGLVESAMARLNRPPSLPADASPALATLLARMTALDPGARPSAAEVATALTALRGAMTVPELPVTAPLARPIPASEAMTAELPAIPIGAARRRKRSRMVPVAAVAAGVVLVSGMALLPRWQAGDAGSIAAPAASAAPHVPTAAASASAAPIAGTGGGHDTSGTVSGAALVSHTAAAARTNTGGTSAAPTSRKHVVVHHHKAVKPRKGKKAAKPRNAAKAPRPAPAPHAAHKASPHHH